MHLETIEERSLVGVDHTPRAGDLDELHLIGDESRGYLLEVLLTKLVFLNKQK